MKNNTDKEFEFVVTLPDSLDKSIIDKYQLRTTVGVLTELFANAKEYIIIGAPFIQSVEGLQYGIIGKCMELALDRGVRIDIISTTSSLLNLNIKKELIGNLVHLFRPQKNIDNANTLGSHAKFFIVDKSIAYLGSANYTFKGINENLEMGFLVKGAAALQIYNFIKDLCNKGFFVEN